MTASRNLAFDILCFFDFAVLLRTGPKDYAFWGRSPDFYDALFPPSGGVPCAAPWEQSPMLDFFVEEAEEFFTSGREGMISSGVWEEEGRTEHDTALIAMAARIGNAQALVIRLLREDYAERVSLLRRARVHLLEKRELETNLAMFKERSRIDGLTNIFNRATFTELLHDEIKRSAILGYPLSLLILDIDNFKNVNDTYGHLTGDKVLREMGTLLKASLRRNDIVARYGGEEFAVLLPGEHPDQAGTIAEKIRAALEAMDIPDTPRITVSIGLSVYAPEEPAEDFFKRTDEALYEAKRTGKNRVCVR